MSEKVLAFARILMLILSSLVGPLGRRGRKKRPPPE